MRFLLILSLFLVFSCTNSNTKKSPDKFVSAVSDNAKTVAVEFAIQGMTCTGCEQTIQSGIASLKGVKQVKANFKNGKAFVEFLPDVVDTIQLKEKIATSGYVVAGIKSIPVDSLRARL
jgi:copper chaperone CopZ